MRHRINYKIGQIIGECYYLRDVESIGNRKALFKCMCGTEFEAVINSVKVGATKSCGCAKLKAIKIHGMSKHPSYKRWLIMKERCYSKSNVVYRHYGGRGIRVCDEWKDDFMNYYTYIMALPNSNKNGYTIDRIDNDGNYEPGNVRWANRHTQMANTRTRKSSTGKTGVYKNYKKYSSNITVNGNILFLGNYNTISEAVTARNNYIIQNSLHEYPIQKP